jgi:uncharacterized repeat protein (TIGR01451 family)
LTGLLALLLALTSVPALAITASATKDLTCAGFRFGSDLNCTAGEFTVGASFSADNGTSPFCMAGQNFDFKVVVSLTGSNTDRQDVGIFVGQSGNDPKLATAGNNCSVASFPKTPSPWKDNDGDGCGDYLGGGSSNTTVDEIKVVCQGGSTGALQIPYVVTYWQNNGNVCTGATDVVPGSKSKCNSGIALVDGVVAVNAGAWLDVTKQTNPAGDTQSFSFTATGPAGTKVIALVGATLTSTSSTGGTYIPSTISAATNSTTFPLKGGETARVFMTALTASQTLTVTEAAATGWDPTAALSCSATTGTPTFTTNNTTRTATASLNTTNTAGACTFANTKRARVTVTKVSNGDVGTFNFTGTNGWTSQNITTTASGVGVSGATQTLVQSTPTNLIEGAVANFLLTGITCTGLGAGGTATNDLTNRTVSLNAAAMAPGVNINCTFANGRTRTLSVVKSLSPVSDTGQFIMNANGTSGTAGGNGASASATVGTGSVVTFSESAAAGTSLLNYTTTYSCNTSPATTGSTTSGSLTMPNANVTCTMTNTRIPRPLMSVTKLSSVISDPVNGTAANAKAIPGSVVRYTITVKNDAAAVGNATNVVTTDPIPAQLTYVAGSIKLNGVTQTDASDSPTDNSDYSATTAGTVTVNLGTMAPGTTHLITFDAVVK